MTESTSFLTTAQAVARLGVKQATLYAYVSRGTLPKHVSPDGRTSLFDPADLARLERRTGQRRGAPADVIVASELTLIDGGRVWYRGLDAVAASRERHFEEIAGWLWTGSFDPMDPWRAEKRSLAAGTAAHAALDRASPAQRMLLIAGAVAATHASRLPTSGLAAASDLMACLVDALPGPVSRDTRYAVRLWRKLTARAMSPELIDALDAALSLTCEHGLTHPALIARLSAASGNRVASAVASALHAEWVTLPSLDRLEKALGVAATDGPSAAADSLDADAVEIGFTADGRGPVLLDLLPPDERSVVDGLVRTVQASPSATFGVAALSWASGMRAGSAAAITLASRAVGLIAHAREEYRRTTPFRPRLAYAGPPPGGAAPRRTLDAVTDYLSRA